MEKLLKTICAVVSVYYLISSVCLAASLNGTSDVVIVKFGNNSTDVKGSGLLDSTPKKYYMDTLCGRTLQLQSRNAIRVAPWTNKYPPAGANCVVGVQSRAYQNYDIGVTFKEVRMSSAPSSRVCYNSRLDLYNGESTSSGSLISGKNGICGSNTGREQYVTTANSVTFRFTTSRSFVRSYQYFEAVVTPFHYGRCAHDEYKCANNKCIRSSLVCDGYDNCGDDSDEKECAKIALSIAAIIGIVVGCVIFIAIILTIVICCCCCAACGYERI